MVTNYKQHRAKGHYFLWMSRAKNLCIILQNYSHLHNFISIFTRAFSLNLSNSKWPRHSTFHYYFFRPKYQQLMRSETFSIESTKKLSNWNMNVRLSVLRLAVGKGSCQLKIDRGVRFPEPLVLFLIGMRSIRMAHSELLEMGVLVLFLWHFPQVYKTTDHWKSFAHFVSSCTCGEHHQPGCKQRYSWRYSLKTIRLNKK